MEANTIIAVIRAFLKGCFDSFRGSVSLFYLDSKINEKVAIERVKRSDSTRKKKFVQEVYKDGQVLKKFCFCCGINVFAFWASLIAFEYLISFIGWAISFIGDLSVVKTVLSKIFDAIFIIPVFILSRSVSTIIFQDIADGVFWCTRGKSTYFSSFSKLIADTFFSIIIQTLFLLQAVVVSKFLPAHVGKILYIVHMCLLYSLYAFEYKWCKIGWELHQRLLFIEANWPYFIGFGLPLAILTTLPESYLASGYVFTLFFPLFIISANEARPITKVCDFQLQLFSLVITLSNMICSKTIKRNVHIPSTPKKIKK